MNQENNEFDNLNENEKNEVILTERLHLRKFEEYIDILYRPNHEYIEFVTNDENGYRKIEELLKMSRDDFREYLNNKRIYITKKKYLEISKSPKEEWYKGAWAIQTKNILKKLNKENIIEEPIWRI